MKKDSNDEKEDNEIIVALLISSLDRVTYDDDGTTEDP